MEKALFITGTDTDIGKTYVACKLIKQYVQQGYKVVGMKPVAAGCDLVNGEWVNEDAFLLTEVSNVEAPLSLVNPYCFKSPVSPHIAAKQENVEIDLNVIKQAYDQLCELADIVIVEGAGGLLVPLNENETIIDLAKILQIPVVLVVGMKLGCINHTLLSYEVLKAHNIEVLAWVANQLEPKMAVLDQNIATIDKMLFNINRLDLK